jgi:cytidylate kinase
LTEHLDARKQRIAISGLTAAGKTTLSLKIVHNYGLSYVSGSQVLRGLLGDTSSEWQPSIDERRETLALEQQVDRTVFERFSDCTEGVFDTWSLPWLARGEAESIWIESDFESRVRKCMVSYLERGISISYAESKAIVLAKDQKSRDVMRLNWNFDLFFDRSPFNLVLDASQLIPEISIRAARRGANLLYRAALHGLSELRTGRESAVHGSAGDSEDVSALIVTIRP